MVFTSATINPETLVERLDAAWERRAALRADAGTDLFRLVHGFGDQLPGLNIDCAGDLVVIWERRQDAYDLSMVADWIEQRLAPVAVLHKGVRFGKDGGGGAVLRGEMPAGECCVIEAGLRFALQPLAAQNLGIFIDSRPVRAWLQKNSADRIVLNTFAYTGSLGVAARAGGARGCVQVDLQRAQLQRARRNHELNGQSIDDRDLMKADCLRWLRRRKRQVGGLILDPPPRLPGRRSGDPQAWKALVCGGAPLLEEGGWLLAMLNRRGLSREDWEASIVGAAAEAGVSLTPFWKGTSGDDFWEPDPECRLRATAFRRA
jgi:23S rRNA (cytosine1962-C5)-methyltransferase